MQELIELMRRLRDPERGCPWDRQQTFETIAPYTIEEAYEVADAITRGSPEDLKDELGDLLFQVVFHAVMAEEQGSFAFEDVVNVIVEKMRRRHPHVFESSNMPMDEASLRASWERIKAAERSSNAPVQRGVLDGVTPGLPGLARAQKLQRRASMAGFDWPDIGGVMDKLDEEHAELRAEVERLDRGGGSESPQDKDEVRQRIGEELGDVIFTCVNLARRIGVDADAALRGANERFTSRFSAMERLAKEAGQELGELSLGEWDELWEQAKRE